MFGQVRISFCVFFFYPVFTAFVGHLPFICGTLARFASNASVAREPHKCLSRAVLVSLAGGKICAFRRCRQASSAQDAMHRSAFVPFLVLCRRFAYLLEEDLGKVVLVVETELFGYFLDFQLRKVQQLACFLNLQLVEVVQRRLSGLFQKHLPEVRRRVPHVSGNVLQRQLLG